MKKMGWKRNDVFEVLKDTIDTLFAPEDQKNKVRQQIQKYIAAPDVYQNPQFNDRLHYYD